MSEPIITPAAEKDLVAISDYIAQVAGANVALDLCARLLATIQRIGLRPSAGFHRTELADERHRCWLAHPYVIVYRTDLRPVHIVRVLHGARDLGPLLDDLTA